MQHFDRHPPCKINNRNIEAHKQLIRAQIGFLAYFDVTKKCMALTYHCIPVQ